MSHPAAHDLVSPWFFADPGPTLDRRRARAPVAFDEALGAWVLTRHADVAKVVDDARFDPWGDDELLDGDRELRGWLPFGGAAPDGPLRRELGAAMSPSRVEALAPLASAIASDALGPARGRSSAFDVVPELAEPLAGRAIAALVGIPDADVARIRAQSFDLLAFLGRRGDGRANAARARAAADALIAQFEDLVERKRRQPAADLASSLVDAAGRKSIATGDVVRGLLGFAVGTLAMTERLLGHVVLALLTRPDAWARVVGEPALAPAAVSETLRHNGPLLCVFRRAREDVSIDGRTVRAGQTVACMIHAAHHDPAVFSAPERFELGRRPVTFLGFGGASGSPHEAVTRLLVQVATRTLVEQMPQLHLAGAAPRSGHLVLRGLARLPVRHRRQRHGVPLEAFERTRIVARAQG